MSIPKKDYWSYTWRASLLTFTFGCGFWWRELMPDPAFSAFGTYMSLLSLFHLSEFLTIALIKPRALKIDSFLLNHSIEYWVAAIASWVEFFIEGYLCPTVNECTIIYVIGLMCCLTGEVVRKSAMMTAGSNFSHLVAQTKEKQHILVTTGVYGIVRHPSYVGWFIWSIGTQLVLCNPICSIGYVLVSWVFFKERIEDEEYFLVKHLFKDEYIEYKKKVPSGIPFVSGWEDGMSSGDEY